MHVKNPRRPDLFLLLLLGTFLGAAVTQTSAEGAQNRTAAQDAVLKARRDGAPFNGEVVVVKEGSDALIECNVTGVYDDFHWYNPKGLLLEEEGGGKLHQHCLMRLYSPFIMHRRPVGTSHNPSVDLCLDFDSRVKLLSMARCRSK